MPIRAALIALVALAGPAAAQRGPGFPGSGVGLPASGVPTNPFASNYPSAQPPVLMERPAPRVHRPRRAGRERLSPPGRIGR
ncbi:hypothetical protein [Methylobacterium segetis]|uniref:hypothetical protein n=1 Tax=Methylobacterium segetis TaxID=2488750 RepID=UPI001042A7D3|nr:hypothetical protein [Methylobacterium segetis]